MDARTVLIDHLPALPEVILLVGACALMIVDLYVKSERRNLSFQVAQAMLLLCMLATLFVQWVRGLPAPPLYLFNGLFVFDVMSSLLKLVSYLAVWATLIYSRQYLVDRGLLRGEFLTLLLFSLLGMMVMISANSFLTMYLGLELMSLCLYAMVALDRDSAISTEAAMKYFVLGALSSGLLLYGMSMIYGATGTLDISEAARRVSRLAATTDRSLLVFGLVFMVAGIAFKLGAAPFHMWLPDVYQGAPTAITLLIAADAYSTALFYVVVYVLMTLGAFGVLLSLSRKGFECENLDDLRGLNRRSPWFAFVMLVLMFSLAGLPPTAGFYAKLAVLSSAVQAGQILLPGGARVLSLVGGLYLLRLVQLMYFDQPKGNRPGAGHSEKRV